MKPDKYTQSTKSEYDRSISLRLIHGRLTKARYKAIKRWARKQDFSDHCGCEHDCCGHHFRTYAKVRFYPHRNITTIRITHLYNY